MRADSAAVAVPALKDGASRQYKNKSRRARPDVTSARDFAVQPEYVRCCAHAPAPRPKTYSFWYWRKNSPGTRFRTQYRCNSWRCAGCAPHQASVVFARVREAFSSFSPRDCVFAVLTLDPREHRRGVSDLGGVYRDFGRRMQRLRQRWQAQAERDGLDWCGSRWVAIIEAHRSGIPHLNIVLHAPALAAHLREQYAAARLIGRSHREATLLAGEWRRHAIECGFGWSSTLESVCQGDETRSLDAIAGYIAKAAKRADQVHGEIAKLSQLPTMAPRNFRRVRSGKGFLPPVRKDPAWTGTIMRRWRTRDGDEDAESLVRRPKNMLYRLQVLQCVAEEIRLARVDEDIASQLASHDASVRAYARIISDSLTAPATTTYYFEEVRPDEKREENGRNSSYFSAPPRSINGLSGAMCCRSRTQQGAISPAVCAGYDHLQGGTVCVRGADALRAGYAGGAGSRHALRHGGGDRIFGPGSPGMAASCRGPRQLMLYGSDRTLETRNQPHLFARCEQSDSSHHTNR